MEKVYRPETRPLARGNISEEQVGEYLFLYDESSGNVHQLNEGATLVWLLCDGTLDVESIAGEIASSFGLPEREVLGDVRDTVAKFHSLGLLE